MLSAFAGGCSGDKIEEAVSGDGLIHNSDGSVSVGNIYCNATNGKLCVFSLVNGVEKVFAELDYESKLDETAVDKGIIVADMDFDGEKDIAYPTNIEYGDAAYRCLTWDKTNMCFTVNEELSGRVGIKIDANDRSLSFLESDNGAIVRNTYYWRNGKLAPIAQRDKNG